eukprot:CAMPEP_0185576034 /NCGR_PEP_ID=MMETSP0434-20130131/7065_1 /TAXON_ID=626734 ORGANISM="Favella taraikaensis, Strain Fe Narragansett Bay" /NCGR_SAMPLE_ID=MMETSP0434 /ASSEMBLY_ACC=CAM_ASM_000379 /LENGTH=84 /DNA_ID=CAMNT_0028193095 /DNA_START=1103 /DNA_END=1354 /DNA_ORIENTATION=-
MEELQCELFGHFGITDGLEVEELRPGEALGEALKLKVFVADHSGDHALIVQEVQDQELELLAEELPKADIDLSFDISHVKGRRR